MFGLKADYTLDIPDRYFTLENYEGGVPRWCPGCGDHAVLSTVQRICRDKQIPTEKVMAVSGIGCSSRFPHYMHAYGFHGLHGRALPVACGIRARRPDLHVWVATGDGDCCSIGAGHWIHALRYNMDMTVMLFDNAVYGLTKNQTSPTSPQGASTNTHPRGSWLPPLNILQATLGMTNISFVARTVDWNPLHLYQTLKAAHDHKGTSFVHILQRCPAFSATVWEEAQKNPDQMEILEHEKGIPVDDAVGRLYKNRVVHDPTDLHTARELATPRDRIPIGLFFHDPDAPCYEEYTTHGLDQGTEEKLQAIEAELDHFAI
jgi:2-oxoglutarate ferredoxin oxidoreductase subunit beta